VKRTDALKLFLIAVLLAIVLALLVAILGTAPLAEAQQVPRIALVVAGPPACPTNAGRDAFFRRMKRTRVCVGNKPCRG
jgi:hypothetical protein